MDVADNPFVLQGRRTPLREKPCEYFTSSEKTLTSRNLSQTLLSSRSTSRNTTNESSFRHSQDASNIPRQRNSKSSEFSLDLGSLNSSFNKSFNKSVSFNEKPQYAGDSGVDEGDDMSLQDEFEAELQKLISQDDDENEQIERNLAGRPLNDDKSSWFVEPVHLTRSSEFPVFASLGAKENRISSARRTTGMLGTELAQKKVASDFSLSEEARQYYPVTLGAMPEIMQTVTPPPPSLEFSVRGRRSAKKNEKDVPREKAVSDFNYLQASQPFLDGSVVASPYQYELARLKMERLRLEESLILETKRKEEMERIRGPEPKWYELKTPKFSYEHMKNNQLLKSKKEWQNLLDYRQKLTKASQEFGTSTI